MYTQEKITYLKKFLQLTESLVQYIQEEQYEYIDVCLHQRQEIMRRIDELDGNVGQQVVAQEKQAFLSLLRTIEHRNQVFIDLAAVRKGEMAAALQKLKASRRISHSYYGSYRNQDGYYIDQTIGLRER